MTIFFNNVNAQYLFVSSQLETEGAKTSTYTISSPADVSVNFVQTPGQDGILHYPIIYAAQIKVFVNEILQFSSGNLSIILNWSCKLNNVPTSSVVKVQLVYALTVPQSLPLPPATIEVTSRHIYKDISVEYVGDTTSPNYNLSQNFPNPFNPLTTISYQVKEKGFVTLKVFDMIGKEVANLVNETQDEGQYSVNFDANNLPSGVYVYSLNVNGFVQNNKMTLLK